MKSTYASGTATRGWAVLWMAAATHWCVYMCVCIVVLEAHVNTLWNTAMVLKCAIEEQSGYHYSICVSKCGRPSRTFFHQHMHFNAKMSFFF